MKGICPSLVLWCIFTISNSHPPLMMIMAVNFQLPLNFYFEYIFGNLKRNVKVLTMKSFVNLKVQVNLFSLCDGLWFSFVFKSSRHKFHSWNSCLLWRASIQDLSSGKRILKISQKKDLEQQKCFGSIF